MAGPTQPVSPYAPGTRRALKDHSRQWHDFELVYPVISRRSGGLSIGINLSHPHVCNFDCIYCLVDRTEAPLEGDVDLLQLHGELNHMIESVCGGEIWQDPKFVDVEPEYRRLCDIAFSGNGEPTAYGKFEGAMEIAVGLKSAHQLDDTRIVLITNASLLARPYVRRALAMLDECHGEVWAKLDAGTEPFYQRVNRCKVPFDRILDNILDCGRQRPIVIQSMFTRIEGRPVDDAEFDAYLGRLADLRTRDCRIRQVQLYTVARAPAESYVSPLTDAELDGLAERFRARLPDLPVNVYYGVDD